MFLINSKFEIAGRNDKFRPYIEDKAVRIKKLYETTRDVICVFLLIQDGGSDSSLILDLKNQARCKSLY